MSLYSNKLKDSQEGIILGIISIEQAIREMKEGKFIIIVDSEDRENEGDLCIAAEMVTPEKITFMATHGRGLICLPLLAERLEELKIPMMVAENTSRFETAFTVSIEAKDGVSTGISAFDRAKTILTAIDPKTKPQDIVKPGHIFPLRAKKGGVLVRAGQTEASIDMARLAGMYPGAVICEIMKDDGTMARMPDLLEFSSRHDINIITIEDLIRYRTKEECLVSRIAESIMPTRFGEFKIIIYESEVDTKEHIALIYGDISNRESVLVRVHSQCLTGEVFHSLRCDCGAQLDTAMSLIAKAGSGVLLYMKQEGRGIGLSNKIRAYHLQDNGLDTVEANIKLGFKPDLRDYGIGAQILKDLEITKMDLLTNNPRKIVGLEGYGLKVVRRIPLEISPTKENKAYLKIKKEKLGHLLEKV